MPTDELSQFGCPRPQVAQNLMLFEQRRTTSTLANWEFLAPAHQLSIGERFSPRPSTNLQMRETAHFLRCVEFALLLDFELLRLTPPIDHC